MAITPVEIILSAKDEASAVINKATNGLFSMESAFEKLAHAGGPMGLVAVAVAGIGAAGIHAAIGLTEAAEKMSHLSRMTGVGIEDLQTWQQVIRQGGGDADSLGGALARLNKALGEGSPYARALGLDMNNTGHAFEQLMEKMSKMSQQEASAFTFKLMGRGSKELLADWGELVEKSPEVQRALLETGAMMTDGMKAKTEPLHDALIELDLAWRGFNNTVGVDFLSAGTTAITVLTNLLTKARDLAGELPKIGSFVMHIATLAPPVHTALLAFRALAGNPNASPMPDDNTRGGMFVHGGDTGGQPLFASVEESEKRRVRIEGMITLMRIGETAAARFVDRLDELEASHKRAKAQKDLLAAGETPGGLVDAGAMTFTEAFTTKPRKIASSLQPSGMATDPEAYQRNLVELLKTAPRVSEAITDVAMAWNKMVEDGTSAAAWLDGGMRAVWSGLDSGLGQVFARLNDKTQTWKSATMTILKSLYQEVVALFARMAALSIFRAIVGASNYAMLAAGQITASPSAPPSRMSSSQSSVTINLQTLDTRSAAQAFASPNSPVRSALRQLSLGGAY